MEKIIIINARLVFVLISLFLAKVNYSQEKLNVCPKASFYNVIGIESSVKSLHKTKEIYFVLLEDTVTKVRYIVVTKKMDSIGFQKAKKSIFVFENIIKVGDLYEMKLHMYRPEKSKFVIEASKSVFIDGIYLEIPFDTKVFNRRVYHVYTTYHLVDLYYRPL